MVDIHSHILFGIDDGSSSIEESVNIIKKMYSLGYKHIIATPHYIENTNFNANNRTKKKLIDLLKKELIRQDVPVKIYLGNEIFISENILDVLNSKEISTLNDSNYILVELPMNTNFTNTLDLFYEIQKRGKKIILAHPERYQYFQRNPKLIETYLEEGILLQGNIESLSGKYGPKAKRVFKKLLKQKKYFALASDIHHENSKFFENFYKCKIKLKKLTDEKTVEDLLFNNPLKIIEDSTNSDK